MAGTSFAKPGELFVAENYLGHRVARIDSNGNVYTFVSIAAVYGITFDQRGILYLTSQSFDNGDVPGVYQVNRKGTKIRPFYTGQLFSGEDDALTFDAFGNLFVLHNVLSHRHGIAKIAPDGTATEFANDVVGTDLAFDSAGNLYVADNSTHNVFSYARRNPFDLRPGFRASTWPGL